MSEPESPQGERGTTRAGRPEERAEGGHRDVAVEVTIAAPLETVWRALRDRDEIRRWHGWDCDELDPEIDIIYFTEASEPEPATAGTRTLVTGGCVFELAATGAGTVVRVVMAEPPDSAAWHGFYDDIREGWLTFVQQLRYALERHPGEDRSTVYVSGPPLDPGQPGIAELLGLAAVTGAPGERYAASLATGDEATGEVWFRSAHQLGLTVTGWGDGLLVVADRWTPAGPVGAVLTTYGMADGAVAALAERWRAWWAKHFETGSTSS